ncbi:MAG: PfkB family carbohydrate kinase [Thermoproteota archaeon]
MTKCSIDVISLPTYDVVEGDKILGGPLYYAWKALESIEASAELRVPAPIDMGGYPRGSRPKPSCYLVFDIDEAEDGSRSLKVLRECKADTLWLGGEALLLSPVYWDVGSDVLARLHHYRVALADLQGFFRVAGWVSRSIETRLDVGVAAVLHALVHGAGTIVAKASIEDLNYNVYNVEVLEVLAASFPQLVLTLGSSGSVAWDSGGALLYVAADPVKGTRTTGAGDMFSATLLLSLCEGADMEDSLCRASSVVSCLLECRKLSTSLRGCNCRSFYEKPKCRLQRLTHHSSYIKVLSDVYTAWG